MNVKLYYKCGECGKEYEDFQQANLCCIDNKEFIFERMKLIEHIRKELPKSIDNVEDYVKAVHYYNKLNVCGNDLSANSLKESIATMCEIYLHNLGVKLMDKLNLDPEYYNIFEKDVCIDDTYYKTFEVYDVLECYITDNYKYFNSIIQKED